MRSASICTSLIEDETMPMIVLGNHSHGEFQHREVYFPSEYDPLDQSSSASSSTLLPYTTSHHLRRKPLLSLRKTWSHALSNFLSAFQRGGGGGDIDIHHHPQQRRSKFNAPAEKGFPLLVADDQEEEEQEREKERARSPWSKSEIFVQTEIEVRKGWWIEHGGREDGEEEEEEQGVRCQSLGGPRRLRAQTTSRLNPFRRSMFFEEVSAG